MINLRICLGRQPTVNDVMCTVYLSKQVVGLRLHYEVRSISPNQYLGESETFGLASRRLHPRKMQDNSEKYIGKLESGSQLKKTMKTLRT
jgi:hypothetical protein